MKSLVLVEGQQVWEQGEAEEIGSHGPEGHEPWLAGPQSGNQDCTGVILPEFDDGALEEQNGRKDVQETRVLGSHKGVTH